MIFDAKKDTGVIASPIVAAIFLAITMLFNKTRSPNSLWVAGLIGGILLAFILCNMLTIKYILTEEELIIKTCFLKTVLKLEKIVQIVHAKGPYSFSASSYEQLKLTYIDGQKIRISPQRMAEFEECLAQAIEKQGKCKISKETEARI